MLIQLDFRPQARQLRQFGFIAFVVLGVLAAVAFFRGTLFGFDVGDAARPVAAALGAVGGVSALFSLAWPQGNRPLFVALSVVAFPIGFVVSHIVLAVLFFVILTPVGLALRLLGRDLLDRSFEKDKKSYWIDLPQSIQKRDYFRQF
jgi:hypothetical protein